MLTLHISVFFPITLERFAKILVKKIFLYNVLSDMSFNSCQISGLQLNAGKYSVFVILVDTQITPGDLKGRVIEDAHQHGGRYALLPCIIAEGLAQRVAADIAAKSHHFRRVADNPIGLISGQWGVRLAVADKRIGITFGMPRLGLGPESGQDRAQFHI